jgi:hypothetical protein
LQERELKDLKADFGAVGDGVTDDTASVQAALSWVAAARSSLSIPESSGFYAIYAPLTVVQGASFAVYGPHRQGADFRTGLLWKGAPGLNMLTLDGCRDSEWHGFAIDAGVSAAIEPAVLLDIDKLTAGSWNSRKNTFGGMLLRGGSTATVRISHTTPVNNEANLFDQCGIFSVPGSIWTPAGGNAGPVGFQIKHVNAKANIIRNCEISGKAYAVDIVDGSFRVRDTEFSGCGTWVRNAGRGEPCVIDGCDGDSSRTFLETTLTQTSPVIASGNRFFPLHDGPLFVFGDTIGPVTLLNNEFANGAYKAPALSYSSIPGNGPMVTAIGNTFPNDQILPVPTPANAARLRSLYMLANMYYTSGNVRNLMNDYLVPNRNTGQSLAGLQIHGSSGFRGEVQSVVQAVQAIQTNQPVASVTTTAFWTLRSTPTFQPGLFEGQELRLTNTGVNDLGLLDEKSLPGTQLCLLERSPVFKPKASATFQWTAAYGGRWIQVSPVVTPL